MASSVTEPGELEQRLIWRIEDLVISSAERKATLPLVADNELVDEGPGTPHPITGRKFSSTQVNLSFEDAERVKQISLALIPDDELDPEEGREDRAHVTIKYGIHAEDPYDVAKALEGIGPVRAIIGKISIFDTNPDYDVVKFDVQSTDLKKLNKVIAEATEVTDTQPSYSPHLTLAYVKKGFGQKYVGMTTELTGLHLEFGYVLFSSRNGSETEILLSEIVHQDEWKYSEDQPRDERGRFTSGRNEATGLKDVEGSRSVAELESLLEKSYSGYWNREGQQVTIHQAVIEGRTHPLAGPAGDQFYESLGHSKEAIEELRKVLDDHGQGGAAQVFADQRIITGLSEQSPFGAALRDTAITETLLLNVRSSAFEKENNVPMMLYRRGDTGINKVESWTANARGAQTQHTGGSRRIQPDKEKSVSEMLSDGYISIAGIGQLAGSPGESEITMIKLGPK